MRVITLSGTTINVCEYNDLSEEAKQAAKDYIIKYTHWYKYLAHKCKKEFKNEFMTEFGISSDNVTPLSSRIQIHIFTKDYNSELCAIAASIYLNELSDIVKERLFNEVSLTKEQRENLISENPLIRISGNMYSNGNYRVLVYMDGASKNEATDEAYKSISNKMTSYIDALNERFTKQVNKFMGEENNDFTEAEINEICNLYGYEFLSNGDRFIDTSRK